MSLFAAGLGSLAQAQFTWTSGAIPKASFASGETLTISTTADHDFNGQAITNAGTVTWTGGSLRAGNGGTFTNASGGILDDASSGTFGNSGIGGATMTFTNASGATYNLSVGKTIPVSFTNDGTLNVTAGTVQFSGGGSSAGAINATTSGVIVRFTNSFSVPDASKLAGPGVFELTNGTLTLAGTLNAPTFNQTGGTLAGTLSIPNTFNWSGGNWNAPGTTTIASTGTLNLTTTASHNFDGHAIINDGTVQWGGGNFVAGNGGTVTNNANFSATAAGTFGNSGVGGANPVFTNTATATFTKSGPGTQTTFNVPFNNDGAVGVQSGTLALNGGGTSAASGSFAVSAGATLNFGSGTYAVANGTSFSGAGTFGLIGGTLSIASGSAPMSNLTVSGGTLSGAGAASIGTLTHSNGTLALQALTLTGPGSTWTGGNWNGSAGSTATIDTGAVLGISYVSDHHYYDYRLVTNSGTVNWSSGYIRGGHGGGFINNATWNDSNAASVAFDNYYGGTAPTFTNSGTGTYTKTGAGSVAFNTPFNNDNDVVVSAGTLSLNGGGATSGTGTFAVGSGATINFGGGTSTLASGTAFSGSGTVGLSGGTLAIAADNATISNLTVNGGTLTGAGSATIGNLAISSGSLGLSSFTLTGTGSTWTGGNWNGAAGSTASIAAGAVLGISYVSDHHYFDSRLVTNDGTVNWSSGYIRGGHGGGFVNNASWFDSNTGTVAFDNYYGGTAPTFTNTTTGTYTKSGAGTVYFYGPFSNAGSVQVQAGTLVLNGGGNNATAGGITTAPGATVQFASDFTVADGAGLNGSGTFVLSGGTLTIGGNVNGSIFQQTGGTLGGSPTLTGTFNWSAGNWNGQPGIPVTTIASGATLNLAGTGSKDFNQRAIVNEGTVNWTPSYLRAGQGASFTNAAGGTFNDLNSANYTVYNPFGGTFAFTNNGTYVRNVSGTTYFDTTFNNHGTVNLQQGDMQIRQGGTMGATSVVNASAGTTFYFTNDYTLADGSVLNGPGTFYQTGGILTFANLRSGNFNWYSGNWNGTGNSGIAHGSVVNLVSANVKDLNSRAVTNHGVVNWQAGHIRSGQGGTFTNAADGVFNDSNTSGYTIHNGYGGSFEFTNDGTYNRNAAGTTSYLDTVFNNRGAVNVLAGDLQLRGGGTMSASGTIAAATGTNVYFTNSYTIADGASLSGAGSFWLTNGTLTLNGSIGVGTFYQTSGTLAGNNTLNGAFNWSSGYWNAPGAGYTTTIAPGATLMLATSGNKDFDSRAIVNQGTATWTSGYLRGGHGSSFTNATGATFIDQNVSGYSVHNAYGSNVGDNPVAFTNNGTYVRNVGGVTYFDVLFNNHGTLNLQQGDMQLRQGGTMGATSTVNGSVGTNLYFTSDYTLEDGARFVGAGNFMQTGGRLTVNGNLKATAFNWYAGNWNATTNVTTTIDATSVLNLVSSNSKDFDYRSITNNGVTNWSSGYVRAGHGSVFTNGIGGVFNDQNSPGYSFHNLFGGSFTFVNDGTYNRAVGGVTYFDTTFDNNGTINLSQGEMRLRQGGTMGATSIVNASAGTNFYLESDYTLLPGARFNGTGNIMQIAGQLTFSNLKASTFNWYSGNWRGTGSSAIDSTTVLNLVSGANKDFYQRNVTNHGVTNWYSGYVVGGDGSVFTNAADGTFNDLNSPGYTVNNPFGGSFTFVNDGTYVRNVGGTTGIDIPFNNHGTINLQQGVLQLRQGGTMSATSIVNTSAGANFYLTNNYTILDGAQFTGAGAVWQTGGTLSVEKLRASNFNWDGGNWNSADNSGVTSIIAAGSNLNLTSGSNKDFNGRVIENQGTMTWNSGYIRGSNGSQIINSGTFNDANSPGYTIHNPVGGTFTISNSGTYHRNVGGTTQVQVPFSNTGTVRSSGGGTLAFTSTFTNTGGTLAVSGGNLSFSNPLNVGTGTVSGSGTITASTVTAGGAVTPGNPTGLLTISGHLTLLSTAQSAFEIGGTTRGTDYDAINVTGNAALAGSLGVAFVNGAYASLTGSESFTLLNATAVSGAFSNVATGTRFNSADGVGSFLLTVAGTNITLSNFILSPTTYIWSGGDLSTAGNVTPTLLVNRTVDAGTSLAIATSADHDFNGQVLTNNGRIDWSGGRIRGGDGSVLVNNATFNDVVTTATDVNAELADHRSSFTNALGGTYTKSGNVTTRFLVPFNNSGAIQILAGLLELAGGGLNSGTGAIQTSAGAVTLFSNNYSLADGSLLTGAGEYQLTGGTLVASGTVTVSTLTLSGGALDGSQTFVNSLLNWSGSSWNTGGATTTIGTGSRLVLTGGDHDYNRRAIVNQGIVDWNAGRLRSGDGGSFTNQATFNDKVSIDTDANNDLADHSTSFTNALGATYLKTGNAVTRFLGVPFYNNGTVAVQAGTLQFHGGGLNSGTGAIQTAAGAVTLFSNNYSLADGSLLTGAGEYRLTGGTLVANGIVTVSTLNLSGGALAGSQTFSNSLLNWSSGAWNAGGADTTTIGGGSRLVLSVSDHDYNRRAIVNLGIVDWNAGRLRSGDGGSFTNRGTFNDNVSTDTDANNDLADHSTSFTNALGATYLKTGNAVTRFLGVPFYNDGTVAVQAGTLQFHGGGSLSGTGRFDVSTGSHVLFSNSYNLQAGATLAGSGDYQAAGGLLSVSGLVHVQNLNLAGAQLGGTHTFDGTLTWSAGNFNGSGTTTIAAGSTLTISGGSDHDFNQRRITNDGTVNWTGGRLRSGDSGSILNNGTWNDTASSNVNADLADHQASFTNSGNYNKTAAGITTFQVPFTNTNGIVLVSAGTLRFSNGFSQSAGTVTVAQGAAVQFDGGVDLAGGSIGGSGTVVADVTNRGLLSPGSSPGQLNITGNLTLTSTSSLLIELGGTSAGTNYDLLAVSGDANLNGVLQLNFVNGFSGLISSGNTFTVLTSTNLIGAFANVPVTGSRLTTLDGFGSFQVNFGASSIFATNAVVLSNFAAVPEPSTWALLIAGVVLVAFQVRRRK